MTENLLQKLEEKTMALLAELEKLRTENKKLKQENSSLKTEKESSTEKIQSLVSLLETESLEALSSLPNEQLFLSEEVVNAA